MTGNTPLKLISMSEINAEEVQWLWYPYIPLGKLTILQGDPGEGKTAFTVEVAQLDGTSITFTVNTDKETVGEALLELGVVAGDTTEYGLYITTVNGVTLDYNTDGAYWAFYINGEYASTGVDATNIEAGASYALKAEKAA